LSDHLLEFGFRASVPEQHEFEGQMSMIGGHPPGLSTRYVS
jgi:hypothetical protein